MSKSSNLLFAGLALLALVPLASFSANAPVADNEAGATGNRDLAGGSAPASGAYASEIPEGEVMDNKDFMENGDGSLAADNSAATIPVAQELAFVRDNSFHKPYDERLKSVTQVEYYGTRYVGCEQYSLEIHTARPDRIATLVKTGGSSNFEIRKSSQDVLVRGEPQGLPVEDERALLETFDFDTPILDLEKKHPTIKALGMQKLPGMLTWKLQAERSGGHYRVLYVDSHTGDVVKFTVVNTSGAPVLDVTQHDYRFVEGIRVPFAIDYRDPDGTLLASDRLERIAVTRTRS